MAPSPETPKSASSAHSARPAGAEWYQLLAYTVVELSEGPLIYCRQQEELEQRSLAVRNSDKLLMVRAVDLAGPPAEVERATISAAGRAVELRVEPLTTEANAA